MHLGLDLGTSGLKAVLIDDAQRIVAEADAPLSVSRPRDGWSEQAPADWIAAAESALGALAAKADLSGVRGVGLSGQQHGATLLDAADEPLRPCILWNDTRAHVEAAAMTADADFRRIAGNTIFAGFTAPKLTWVERHEPETFAKLATVLLPKDYLRLWLTGEKAGDMSDCSGTGWLDVAGRAWSDTLLEKTRLTRAAMPRLVEGSEPSGTLRRALAERWGMREDVVVAGGGGDNAASAVGVGVTVPGRAFLSLGTSGVLFAATDAHRPAPETAVHDFCHALPGLWHQMGVILAAADALVWHAKLLGSTPADLTAGLGGLKAPGRTVFLPYLGGERTPMNSATIRGGFVWLDHATDAEAATRAVLEGVAFAFRDNRDALAAAGTTIDSLLAVGGGARSEYWMRAIATALDTPLQVPEGAAVGGAYGAARLGMMAATGAGAEIATPPAIAYAVEPDRALVPAFDAAHARFKAARDAIGALA